MQLAYFAGYAMWTYLNTPFLFALHGVETEEIRPWRENDEVWRRLKATFPPGIATHSTVQTFYFDQTGLLKRHDYDVDNFGWNSRCALCVGIQRDLRNYGADQAKGVWTSAGWESSADSVGVFD